MKIISAFTERVDYVANKLERSFDLCASDHSSWAGRVSSGIRVRGPDDGLQSSVELRDASSIAQAVLDSCGFQIAGTAFADSGVRTSPPHQFRLDVSVQDRADVAEQDERNREYHNVIVRMRLVRAQDNTPVAEGQGAERYDADGRSRGYGQRAYPERQSAIRYAMERALSGTCEGRRSDYNPESYPHPYDAVYGSTVCGYGASGRITKKGAWNMRYDCRRN